MQAETPGRSSRRRAKTVDYSKEQEFSDDDIFEDNLKDREEVRAPTPSSSRSKRRKTTDVVISYGTVGGDELVNGFGNSTVRYAEKGYDPSLPLIRERYTFAPEYEEDGSPKIECIVGRRPIQDKSKLLTHHEETSNIDEKKKKKLQSPTTEATSRKYVDYEYLVKYKGRSYLHLEWKTASDLESMNKSAKNLYRRFVRKLDSGGGANEDATTLEDPTFDSSFAMPQKIIDEKEVEVRVELSDKELIAWEKQREREEGSESEEEEEEKDVPPLTAKEQVTEMELVEEKEENEDEEVSVSLIPFLPTDDLETKISKLRIALNKDPYYPSHPSSDNAYRDGYVTQPPKKPRASYLFFQCSHRAEYQKRYAGASVGEIMAILGDTWRAMSDEEQAPYLALAREEVEQYEKERALYEKAQRPSELWQPLRRCQQVWKRLYDDGFSTIFREPVDTEMFPDYTEYIDSPMDLGTVEHKLKNKKYQSPEVFARDLRKIWQNCKVYNQHGSAIWHVADYMSKQFERLYHAWVIAFRDRQLRWCDPKARPWELTCRKHDGGCGSKDDDMVLCDFCDAMYGLKCVGLTRVPEGIWHCEVCDRDAKNGGRMFSALAEQAARKRAEMGDIPKKTKLQKKYLVKWAGLGYEHCTWETAEDINDDDLIKQYRFLNSKVPEEPDVTEDELYQVLQQFEWPGEQKMLITPADKKAFLARQNDPAGDIKDVLYAQIRAYSFLKFGKSIPETLSRECGAFCKAQVTQHSQPVVECVYDLIQRIEFNITQFSPYSTIPCLTGEYEAIIPITNKGLMMNVGEVNHSVAFLGYRQFPDGSQGPAEQNQIVRSVGDKIISVNGISTVGKSFKDVIQILREAGKNKFAYMRFWSSRYSVCRSEFTSMGDIGGLLYEDLSKKFHRERKVILQRQKLLNAEEEEKPEVKEEGDDEDAESMVEEEEDDEESLSDYDADDLVMERVSVDKKKAEDLELMNAVAIANGRAPQGFDLSGMNQPMNPPDAIPIASENATPANDYAPVSSENAAPTTSENETQNLEAVPDSATPSKVISQNCETGAKPESTPSKAIKEEPPAKPEPRKPQESTISLCSRLLDIDVGYSSDEGGYADDAYFLDGVDPTFTTKTQAYHCSSQKLLSNTVPIKKNEFSILGDKAKLFIASMLSSTEPDDEDYENYPRPSNKALAQAEAEMMKQLELKAAKPSEEIADGNAKSTTKIEQVSSTTGEVIRVWINVNHAAATLQIPLLDLQSVLKGEYNEEVGDEVGGFRWRYAAADAVVTSGDKLKGRDIKKGRQAYLEFRDKLYSHEEPYVYKGGHKLRDYQVDGVNWLASCWYKRHSCILADEMGLGKTVQIVCYIEHLYRVEKLHRPFLVVVPLSTVEHWRREFEGWTDMICCVYHDRQREWRDVMREYEWYYQDRPHTADYLKFDVLVTTYDTLIGDFDVISTIPWRVTVVDEAHRLRNIKGKLLDCMKQISAKGTLHYGFQSRVLMTGTPLQNNTQELWTLLNFIEPYKFPSMEDFETSFGNMANREQVESLQRKISPFMLRRVKEDVAKDIPSKEETLIDVELTSIQKQYYRAVFEHNHAFLSMGATRATVPKLMNIQMELRKCCNHPFLLDGVEQREMEKYYAELSESGELLNKTPEMQQMILNEHGYIKSSGKMVLLDKLLPKLRQEGHKVLIFSQMVRMLDLISEYCDFKGFRHERLDGRVRGNERQKAIDRFETEADSFVFLLSTRAGGVGINLTAADICIIFDSDWNPQNDVQAQARCHRIGQTKDVMIYRLITSRTFEQEMFDRASKKLGLEQAVLGTFGQDNEDDKPTHKEMEQLLKKGAYALLEDDNDEIGKQFCEDDIDNILAKRTRTRVVEGAKTASWLNKQGMNVTKSKFTSESAAASADVDVDDPMFWQKVMPDFVTPGIMMTKLNDICRQNGAIIPGRRGRKKKLTFKAEENVANDTDKPEPPVEVTNTEVTENQDGSPSTQVKSPKDKQQVSKSIIKKTKEFMSDLQSMMERVLEEEEDGTLQQSDKAICQKLLLTVSVKEKMFTEEQRSLAKVLLRRLEGDRKRRCRTTGEFDDTRRRYRKKERKENKSDVPEQGKRKKRGRKPKNYVEEEETEKNSRKDEDEEEEASLPNSDSEDDWSDVGEDDYKVAKVKRRISRKEARRRRAWACDKDSAAAAGRTWPVIPKNDVLKVLTTMLDEVIKNDNAKGGLFSVPVPPDVFPEYYELVKNPMDYGTMRAKLERGEYRSAQAMQKDFILVMQNCLQFNAADSDIVKEARRQALSMPSLLRNAAMKHNLFISEDGIVFEIHSDDEKEGDNEKEGDGSEKKVPKKRGRKPGWKKAAEGSAPKPRRTARSSPKLVRCNECEGCKRGDDCGTCLACLNKPEFGGDGSLKQGCYARRCINMKSAPDSDNSNNEADDASAIGSGKKPRIRISLSLNGSEKRKGKSIDDDSKVRKRTSKKRPRISQDDNASQETVGRKKDDKLGNHVPSIPKKQKGSQNDQMESIKKNLDNMKTSVNDDSAKADSEQSLKAIQQIPKKELKNNDGNMSDSDESGLIDESNMDSIPSPSKENEVPDDDSTDPYAELDEIKQERLELDIDFDICRQYFTKNGPWKLPKTVGEEKLYDVLRNILNKMCRYDTYKLFAEKVTEEEAPGYSAVVTNPMDFATIRTKITDMTYGTGSKALSSFYHDFLLIFDNCGLYNDKDSDVGKEAARLMSLLPETFAASCLMVGDKKRKKKKAI